MGVPVPSHGVPDPPGLSRLLTDTGTWWLRRPADPAGRHDLLSVSILDADRAPLTASVTRRLRSQSGGSQPISPTAPSPDARRCPRSLPPALFARDSPPRPQSIPLNGGLRLLRWPSRRDAQSRQPDLELLLPRGGCRPLGDLLMLQVLPQ